MLSYTDLKKGVLFIYNEEPHEVLEANFSRMQQRKAVVQAKIRNLSSGKTYDISFQPSNQFKEAEIEKRPLVFLYEHRGEFVFADPQNPKDRFSLNEETVGNNKKWLKSNTQLSAFFFENKLLNLILPVKMDFSVVEAPPGVQGDRAQSGTKTIKIETGAVIQAPLFINTGDIIRINTQTGEYAERVEKV